MSRPGRPLGDARPAQHEGAPGCLLAIDDLRVRFVTRRDVLGRPRAHFDALKGLSLEIAAGECFGIVGESGSGKSTLALAILGLLPLAGGSIRYRGRTLGSCPMDDPLRREIQVVFQDPKASLDPRWPAWALITEAMEIQGATPATRRARAAELMAQVGLPADKLEAFAHAFSGGQRQRLAVARALALRPRLLILDEPTSALDISVQAQVLNLLLALQQQHGLTYVFISHDLAVIGHMCHRLAVLKDGALVETGPAASVLANPQADYTRQLLAAVPVVGATAAPF
jgi:ABC-type microcin C transport system duplicated ATPase subunit YejF